MTVVRNSSCKTCAHATFPSESKANMKAEDPTTGLLARVPCGSSGAQAESCAATRLLLWIVDAVPEAPLASCNWFCWDWAHPHVISVSYGSLRRQAPSTMTLPQGFPSGGLKIFCKAHLWEEYTFRNWQTTIPEALRLLVYQHSVAFLIVDNTRFFRRQWKNPCKVIIYLFIKETNSG